MFGVMELPHIPLRQPLSDFWDRAPECINPFRKIGACPFVARRVPGNQIRRTRPRRSRGSFAARALMAAWGIFPWRACCVWRERREFRAARCAGACVVSASSFSSAHTAVIQEGKHLRSKCRGIRKRPAGSCLIPRPNDPRGSRRNGGHSETRPRVKPDYRATAPRS